MPARTTPATDAFLRRTARQRFAVVTGAAALALAALELLTPTPTRAEGAGTVPAAEPASERAKRDADRVYEMILRHANKPRKVLPSAGTPPAQGTVRAAPTIARVDAPTRPAASEAAPKAASQPDPAVAVAPAREQPEASPGSAALSPSTVSATDSVVMASATQAVVPAAIPSADGVAVEAATTQTAVASKALILLSSVEPEFPARLVRTLGKGSVVVRFEVQSDGSVASTAVVKTSHKGLNEAAQAAVAAWRFKPVGEPASGITELRFE